jgi:hypothetical protein
MTSSVNSEASLTNTSEEQPEQPKKTIGVKIQQNIGICFFYDFEIELILSFLFILKLISMNHNVRLRQYLLRMIQDDDRYTNKFALQ